jgi:hypothetical protein
LRSILPSAFLAFSLAASPLARAGWGISGELEHFRWKESTSPSVTETGPLYGLGLHWTQDRPAGAWRLGYNGRLYFGTVDYNGSILLTGEPITGSSDYQGYTHEGQAIYRFPASAAGTEVVAGLGYDYWKRQLTSVQSEEYRVLYLRLGANFDRREPTGWYAGAGFKYPFSVDENAHFPDIGFDPNPRLHPKGELSPYAELGYRFNPRWTLAGYYDSYRFGESDEVAVIQRGTGTPFNFFQPKSTVDSFGLRLRYNF